MARSNACAPAALRYFSSAPTALSITLTIRSAGLSSSSDRAVHEGHAFVHAAGELELEVGQAAVADAAAKAHDGRLADVRALGQLAHRQAGEAARVGQHQLRHALLGRRQRRDRGADAIEHRRNAVPTATRGARRRVARSLLLVPGAAVARDQRAGGRRAPGAGGIRPGPDAVVGPGVQHRLDPAPRLLLLVAAHEQVQPPGDRVEQQALVGADALGGKRLVEVEVERTPATAARRCPSPWRRAGAAPARPRAAA